MKIFHWALLFSVAISLSGCALACDPRSVQQYFEDDVEVRGPLTVEEVESAEMKSIVKDGREVVLPFGLLHPEWVEFKSQIDSGDCLYSFRTGKETWRAFYGRQGYILMRDDAPVDAILTLMN